MKKASLTGYFFHCINLIVSQCLRGSKVLKYNVFTVYNVKFDYILSSIIDFLFSNSQNFLFISIILYLQSLSRYQTTEKIFVPAAPGMMSIICSALKPSCFSKLRGFSLLRSPLTSLIDSIKISSMSAQLNTD